MPTGAAGSKAKGSSVNRTGMSLKDMVLLGMKDQINTQVQIEEKKGGANHFEQYRDDPEGFIVNVLREKITPDIRDLLNSVKDNVVTQGRSANGVGKTHGAARAIVWFFFTHLREGVQVYTFAAPPEENLKLLLWGEIGNIVHNNPALFSGLDVKLSSMMIKSKDTNEFITGVTIPQSGDPDKRKARFSGKHAPFLMFVGDESDAVPAEIHEAIKSCMSGGHARELLLFNPRAARGPIYQMEKNKECKVVPLSAFTHPNVVTGKNVFPGAVTKEVTAQRIGSWTRPLLPGEKIDSEVFSVPAYFHGYIATRDDGETKYAPLIGNQLRKVIEPAFSYMVLGKYSSMSEEQLIDRSDVEACMERWRQHVHRFGEIPPIRMSPSFGLDVADMGFDTNVLTKKWGNFVGRQMVWMGLDTLKTANITILEMKKDDAEEVFVDSNGVGAGVWPTVNEAGLTAHRIMPQKAATDVAKKEGLVVGEFYRIRDQGWWTMMLEIKNNHKFMLPDDEELADQLCSATYGQLQGRIKICDNDVMKERLGGKSPDKASSLMQLYCPIEDGTGVSTLISNNYLKD